MVIKESQSGNRVDYILSMMLSNYSRSQIKRWILDKKVFVNNQISLPKRIVKKGDVIIIKNIEDKNNNNYNKIVVPQKIPLEIIYEDDDILVINKPSNMVVHPGIRNYKDTVLNALLYRYPSHTEISERAGIVHRLDKNTSGLMIIAKHSTSYNKLIFAFKQRAVIKEYDAIVFGKFLHNTTGIIDKPISRHIVHRNRMMVHNLGKSAITRYSVTEVFKMHSRIRIYPETGRTHQIRVHMAYIQHPLVGDQTYGRKNTFIAGISDELNSYLYFFNRQALHACTLQLLHPITQVQMRWHVPLPDDMINLINILKK